MASWARFSFLILVAAFVACSAGWAETGKSQTIVVPPAANSCPVGVQAQRAPGLTAQIPVDENGSVSKAPVRRCGQHLQLMLNNTGPVAISAIRITVYGWGAKGQAVPAQGFLSHSANASRTMDVAVSVGPRETAKADVWVSGLTAVNSIDLVGVSYEDGSNWESSAADPCRIKPDLLMLISHK